MKPGLEIRVRMGFIQYIAHAAVDVDLAPIETCAEKELRDKFMSAMFQVQPHEAG